MYSEFWMQSVVAGKVPCHHGGVIVLDVKEMILEPVNYSVPRLAKILYVAYIVFKAVNEVIALTISLHDSIWF